MHMHTLAFKVLNFTLCCLENRECEPKLSERKYENEIYTYADFYLSSCLRFHNTTKSKLHRTAFFKDKHILSSEFRE